MPSGYTADIYNGKEVSGAEFIVKCARAFGATVLMRDEPLSTPIPEEFKPSSYHLDSIERAKKQLEMYENMSVEEAQKTMEENYLETLETNRKAREEKLELKSRYEKTLGEVMSWEIPTPEHAKLKKYAIDQLEDSIKFDCNIKYLNDPDESIKENPEGWLQSKIDYYKKDIEYHEKEHQKEIDSINGRNLWIKQLRDSLK